MSRHYHLIHRNHHRELLLLQDFRRPVHHEDHHWFLMSKSSVVDDKKELIKFIVSQIIIDLPAALASPPHPSRTWAVRVFMIFVYILWKFKVECISLKISLKSKRAMGNGLTYNLICGSQTVSFHSANSFLCISRASRSSSSSFVRSSPTSMSYFRRTAWNAWIALSLRIQNSLKFDACGSF